MATVSSSFCAFATAAALLCGGCSFFMRRPPDPVSGTAEPYCSASTASPTLDFIAAGGYGIGGPLVFRFLDDLFRDPYTSQNNDTTILPALSLGVAAIFLVGGIYGVSVASDCRAARRTWRATHAIRQDGP